MLTAAILPQHPSSLHRSWIPAPRPPYPYPALHGLLPQCCVHGGAWSGGAFRA